MMYKMDWMKQPMDYKNCYWVKIMEKSSQECLEMKNQNYDYMFKIL